MQEGTTRSAGVYGSPSTPVRLAANGSILNAYQSKALIRTMLSETAVSLPESHSPSQVRLHSAKVTRGGGRDDDGDQTRQSYGVARGAQRRRLRVKTSRS
jgi:hypothetical protein